MCKNVSDWSHTVQLLKMFIGAMQQVVKPFSGRVAQKGKTVAGCTPSQGSSGPGPDFFTAPDSATCCASAPLSTATSFSAEPQMHCESQAASIGESFSAWKGNRCVCLRV